MSATQTISRRFLFLIVFISGMTTLAVELSASRLLGNVFGTSNIVWANVIGLILLYLTIGYFIGGRVADRYPHPANLMSILVWAGFLSALIPLVSRPILYQAAQAFAGAEAALALGSFVSVIILFSIPITLLGMVSPYAIRLSISQLEDVGRTSGQIYAISTLGSLTGTFVPVLWLIPEIGTTRTFLLFAAILYAVALAGIWVFNRRLFLPYLIMPIIIVIISVVVLSSPTRPPVSGASLQFETESAYNYIQVQEDQQGYRYLYLNEGQGIHSQWHKEQIYYGRTWDYFLAGPYFNDDFQPADMRNLLVIGLATGTIPRQHISVYGNLPIDGVEIDPEIIRVGEQFFEMNKTSMPSLQVYAEDGRYILNQLDKTYTVIAVDAYRPPYIPWHLTTVEFFSEIQQHLDANGVVVINVGRTSTDRRLVNALANTMQQIFPSVHAMDVPYSFNTILVATNQQTSGQNVIDNLATLPQDASPILRQVLNDAAAALTVLEPGEILFTDDRAPLETLVDSLVLNFLLTGGIEELRN
jgi:spermidine synthase